MLQPGRQYTAGTGYRYGFNGKENDNDVKGEGNQQDYGMRIYDLRLGKFLSVDPLTLDYAELTPYQFASNSPVAGIDLDGQEFKYYSTDWRNDPVIIHTNSRDILTFENTRLKLDAKVGEVDHNLIRKAIFIDGKQTNIVFIFSMSDLGYDPKVVNIGGLNLVLPNGIDENDLPTDDDETFWDQLETEDEYLERIKAEANEIINQVLSTADLALLYRRGPRNASKSVKNELRSSISKRTKSKTAHTGETAATRLGRAAHNSYSPGSTYSTSRALNRLKNRLVPDAVDLKNKIVRELKPNNERAIKRGKSQLKKYVEQLEKQYPATKGKWKTVVDTYEKGRNGKIKYNFNKPE